MLKHLKYFALLPCLTLLANSPALAQTAKKERWFEVEVILFTQLGDKSILKEHFPDDTISAAASLRRKRFIELLPAFFKPDTSALRSQLPLCGTTTIEQSFFDQASTPIPYYQSKTLTEIATLLFDDDEMVNEVIVDKGIVDDAIGNIEMLKSNSDSDKVDIFPLTPVINDQFLDKDTVNEQTITAQNTDILTTDILTIDADAFEPLTLEFIALVEQAEQEFSPFKFNLSAVHLSAKTKYRKPQLCRLSPQVLAQLSSQNPSFIANDFIIDKIPKTINAAENVYSKRPYLLSKDSLKLNDIVKQLRWSKNFKPLLHIGWRLAPKGRNYAIPLHIYGGDNLQADYNKKLKQYNESVAAALTHEQEQKQQEPQILVAPLENKLDEQAQYKQALHNRLTNILSQLDNFNKSIDEIITELDDKKLALTVDDQLTLLERKYNIKKPLPPLQNWFLDGWFKVHLNHYLFITANMTILNKSLTKQASDALKIDKTKLEPLKLIEFKQDRRVISKEIHYFDNPYLGMIVQIRRHKRPQPPLEEDDISTD